MQPLQTMKEAFEDDDKIWGLFETFKDNTKEIAENASGEVPACAHCSSIKLILDEGNYVCLDCGTIYDRLIDQNAEWRYYGHEDSKSSDPSRCGLPTNDLLPDSSLGTMIGMKFGECYEMRIIRKYQMWNSMTYKERTLYNVFDTLTVNAVNNGIPQSILDEAKSLYKRVSELQLSRGDNRCGLIASSIYMACKTNNVPRSAKEIAAMFKIRVPVMTKGCKKFQEILQMELKSSTPSDFILRFSSKLNLERHIKDICLFVVNKVDELSIISQTTPPSTAAGCIYLVCIMCDVPVDKKEFANACQISCVTVSKCYKTLHRYRMYLFPKEIVEEFRIT